MPAEDWDPIRRVRAPDKLWAEFGDLAKSKGLTRSVMLRDYMRRAVAEWKGRGGHGRASSGESPSAESS